MGAPPGAHGGPSKFATPQEIFKWYREAKQKSPFCYRNFARTSICYGWNLRLLRLNFIEFHKKIQKLYDEQLITKEEFEGYKQIASV